jgi:uncharacterized Rmd1/YagE family protein
MKMYESFGIANEELMSFSEYGSVVNRGYTITNDKSISQQISEGNSNIRPLVIPKVDNITYLDVVVYNMLGISPY